IETAEQISKAVYGEETRFAKTLDEGLKRLEEDLAPLSEAKQHSPTARAMYSGEKAFKLYDTFGLPLDFMIDAARDAGIGFEQGEVVLDHTPFYAESGGQVGDVGWFYSDDRNTVVADVTGCYAPVQGVRAHRVTARQNIAVGDRVTAVVNADVRRETMRNHTA